MVTVFCYDNGDGYSGCDGDCNDNDVYFLCLSACGGALRKMDRMKIIKRRLSMSLRSARPVDDSLSELAEQMTLNEPAKDNGERSPLP